MLSSSAGIVYMYVCIYICLYMYKQGLVWQKIANGTMIPLSFRAFHIYLKILGYLGFCIFFFLRIPTYNIQYTLVL